MADLGGQMGATAPPLHDENSALAPLFGKKSSPYPDSNAFFFSVLRSECGETYEIGRYSVEKPENPLE